VLIEHQGKRPVVAASAYVAPNAVLCGDVSVGEDTRILFGAEVRVNAVVHANTRLAPGVLVPIGWIAVGDPAQLFSPERHDELWAVQRELDFPGTVFGMPREQATMDRVTGRYVELFGAHRSDRLVDDAQRVASSRVTRQ